jgi:hypothetical protein
MEPYHRQPPAKNAKSKLKKEKEADHTPHYFNRTVPTSTEPKKRKLVQPRHPLHANTQINRTDPTLYKAEPHTEKI